MDIQIVGDNDIAARNHAIVVYDPKKKNYVLLPGDSSGIAYLNEEPAYMPSELSPYDVIVNLEKVNFSLYHFVGNTLNGMIMKKNRYVRYAEC